MQTDTWGREPDKLKERERERGREKKRERERESVCVSEREWQSDREGHRSVC